MIIKEHSNLVNDGVIFDIRSTIDSVDGRL